VALCSAAHGRHGNDPVPGLAVCLLALSPARRVVIGDGEPLDNDTASDVDSVDSRGDDGSLSIAYAVDFLRRAPVNVRRLQLLGDRADALPLLVAALADSPCHAFLRALQMLGTTLNEATATALLAATKDLVHLRRIAVQGPAGLQVIRAAHGTLRDVSIEEWPGTSLDLSALQLATLVVYNCEALTGVLLPPSLTKLGQFAFAECPALRRVDLSHTRVVCAGDIVMFECPALTEVLLPATLTTVGDEACRGCEWLTKIDFSHTQLRRAGSHFLAGCTALTEVLLPPSLAVLDKWAFSRCHSLQRLDLSNTRLQSVDRFLDQCEALREVLMPSSLRSLGDYSFSYCRSLLRMDLSRTQLQDVGSQFLFKCARLKSSGLLLPASLKELGRYAFSGCRSLLRLDLSHTQLQSAGDHLAMDCSALVEVQLPASLESLGDCVFQCCNSLQRVDVSHTRLASVGSWFMIECSSARQVLLPPSLTTIGMCPFQKCPLLPLIDLGAAAPPSNVQT
jgi:hypothetical protein